MDIKRHAVLLVPVLGITLTGGPIVSAGAASTHRSAHVSSASSSEFNLGFARGKVRGRSLAQSTRCSDDVDWPKATGDPYRDGYASGFATGWYTYCGFPDGEHGGHGHERLAPGTTRLNTAGRL